MVSDHDSFQRPQAFIDGGGCRGLQEDVLLSGSWNLNPWFVPSAGAARGGADWLRWRRGELCRSRNMWTSRVNRSHGDLVERGRRRAWVEPLLPGKHPPNTRVMKLWKYPDDQHRAELGPAFTTMTNVCLILVRSEGRLLVQSGRVADHSHRRAECLPVISRVGSITEPRRPCAATDGLATSPATRLRR